MRVIPLEGFDQKGLKTRLLKQRVLDKACMVSVSSAVVVLGRRFLLVGLELRVAAMILLAG